LYIGKYLYNFYCKKHLKLINPAKYNMYELNLSISESDMKPNQKYSQAHYVLYKGIYKTFTNLLNNKTNNYFAKL